MKPARALMARSSTVLPSSSTSRSPTRCRRSGTRSNRASRLLTGARAPVRAVKSRDATLGARRRSDREATIPGGPMVFGAHDECPACGTPVAGDGWCGICGLELGGSEADALRSLAAELAAAEAELNVVWARRDALAKQLASRRWERGMHAATVGPRPRPEPLRRSTDAGAAETGVERRAGARRVPLDGGNVARARRRWLSPRSRGRIWGRPAGRRCSSRSPSSPRRARPRRDSRLPATSGALTGLAIALALIDWQVARRAGAARGLSGAEWWAIGTAVVAAASLALGRVAAPKPAHRAVAVLAPTSAVLAPRVGGELGLERRTRPGPVGRGARRRSPASTGIACAILVVRGLLCVEACVGLGDRRRLRRRRRVRAAHGCPDPHARRRHARRSRSRPDSRSIRPTAAAGHSRLDGVARDRGVPRRGVECGLEPRSVRSVCSRLAAVLGSGAVAIAPSLAEVWRRAAHLVGLLAAAPGLVFAGVAAMIAEFGPTAWLGHAWTGALTREGRRRGRRTAHESRCPIWDGARSRSWRARRLRSRSRCVRVPVCRPGPTQRTGGSSQSASAFSRSGWSRSPGGFSALVALVVATGAVAAAVLGAALAARDRAERARPYGLLAVLPAVPALGWAALTPAASITVLASCCRGRAHRDSGRAIAVVAGGACGTRRGGDDDARCGRRPRRRRVGANRGLRRRDGRGRAARGRLARAARRD